MQKSFALIVLLALAAVQLISAQEQGETGAQQENQVDESYEDAFTEGAAIVWARPGELPAGFDKTQAAMQAMLNEMNSPTNRDGIDKEPFLYNLRQKLVNYLSLCMLDKPKCMTVFAEIDLALEDEEQHKLNLVPYLTECQRRQEEFCTGSSADAKKPNQVGKFFEKIFTACSPKDGKNCPRNKN